MAERHHAAAGERRLTVARYPAFRSARSAQIAPDGSSILYVVSGMDVMTDRRVSAVRQVALADGGADAPVCPGSLARWAPGGRRFVVLRSEGAEQHLLLREAGAAGSESLLAALPASPSSVHWSPDGRRLSFRMRTGAPLGWEIAMPEPPAGARWRSPPRLIDRLHYRSDGVGFVEWGHEHLFVVAPDAAPAQITRGEWSVGAKLSGLVEDKGDTSWSADSTEIYFDGNRALEADLEHGRSHIMAVNVATGAVRQLTSTDGFWMRPVGSPDGRLVAYAGHPRTERMIAPRQLWVCRADGSDHRPLWPELEGDAEDLTWAKDGSGIFFTMRRQGTSNLYFCDLRGRGRMQFEGDHLLTLDSVSHAGLAAGIRRSAHEPGDVVCYSLVRPRAARRVTRINAAVLDEVKLGRVENLKYPSSDGTEIEGWIVLPPDFDSAARYPLIMRIHGGPQSMSSGSFDYELQNYAANGYVVLLQNYRGSTGYGARFGDAIHHDFPNRQVLDDLLYGVDRLLDRGLVDEKRLFVTGSSAGGELTTWVIGHTRRFAAAAVLRPHVDRISTAGTSDLAAWYFASLSAPYWENPRPWLEHSALLKAGAIVTPTLIMTGEDDLRTPIAQSEELFAALKLRRVPTRFVRFPGVAHGPHHEHTSVYMRYQLYVMDWFRQWDPANDSLPEPR